MVGKDEDRRVERRVVAPPALPSRVVVPARWSELSCPHDLGPDPWIVQPQKGVVDPSAAARFADPLMPPACAEHPFVEALTGVAEWLVATQPLAGTETVERDREELDASQRHRGSPSPRDA